MNDEINNTNIIPGTPDEPSTPEALSTPVETAGEQPPISFDTPSAPAVEEPVVKEEEVNPASPVVEATPMVAPMESEEAPVEAPPVSEPVIEDAPSEEIISEPVQEAPVSEPVIEEAPIVEETPAPVVEETPAPEVTSEPTIVNDVVEESVSHSLPLPVLYNERLVPEKRVFSPALRRDLLQRRYGSIL